MTMQSGGGGFPYLRGIQLTKQLALEMADRAAAGLGLEKLFADTFKTNACIDAIKSLAYVYQGTPNFNVIRNAVDVNAVPLMTSDTTPSGVASADNSVDGTRNPFKAFDRDEATDWKTVTALPHFLKYDFGEGNEKKITTYKLRTYPPQPNYSPKDFTFQGSNDDINWTILDTQFGQRMGDLTTFNFVNDTAYRYYKLNVTAIYDSTELLVTTFEMYESAPATSIVSTLALDLAADVTQAILFANVTLGTGTAAYYISTDDGVTWTQVLQGALANLPAGKKLRAKVELTGNATLDFWALAA